MCVRISNCWHRSKTIAWKYRVRENVPVTADESKNRESQLATFSRQLETSQQRIGSRIRQQLINEIQASNNTSNVDSRIPVIKQLSQLDPMVMGEIMALNEEYIKELNISKEREEVIINALHSMIADQNQARGELMLEMQTVEP